MKSMPRSFLFALTLLSLSLVLNVRLAWKVKELTLALPKPLPTKVGVRLEAFPATDLQGHVTSVSFNTGKPTLIYYIDPQCHWCKVNAANFSKLAQALANKGQVIVLSRRTEKMDQFLAETHPPSPVLIISSQKVIRDLDLTSTPQTFFVNAAGRVEHHWFGAYIGDIGVEIQKLFGLHLPNTKLSS